MASLLDVIVSAGLGSGLGLLTAILTQWLMTNRRNRLTAIAALYAIQAEVNSNDMELQRALAGFKIFPSDSGSQPAAMVIASVIQLLPWVDDTIMRSVLASVGPWVSVVTLQDVVRTYKRSRILGRNYVHEPWLKDLLQQPNFKDTTVGLLNTIHEEHLELNRKLICDIRNLNDLRWWQLRRKGIPARDQP